MESDHPLHSSRSTASEATQPTNTRPNSQQESAAEHVRNALQMLRAAPNEVEAQRAVDRRLCLALAALGQPTAWQPNVWPLELEPGAAYAARTAGGVR